MQAETVPALGQLGLDSRVPQLSTAAALRGGRHEWNRSSTSNHRLSRRGPGGGPGSDRRGVQVVGSDTDGALSIVEHPFPVGALVPPHLHTREDEYSIVTEGEIGFRSGDREVVLGAGGYITKPRGELHTMWNAGKVPARMIEVISPAGFENFFRDLTDLTAAAPRPRCDRRTGRHLRPDLRRRGVAARSHRPLRPGSATWSGEQLIEHRRKLWLGGTLLKPSAACRPRLNTLFPHSFWPSSWCRRSPLWRRCRHNRGHS